ncbi:MAG: hypothetical protein RLY97_1442 [Pseudomonadota bacterium]
METIDLRDGLTVDRLIQNPMSGDGPAISMLVDGLDRHTRRDLRKEEIAIAAPFHEGPRWPYVALTFGCFAIWLAFFPLAYYHQLNLATACVASCFFCAYGYLTAHEAMHSNIARAGSKNRWLNEAVGWVSNFPIVFPFSMARMMHLRHHSHCNDPLQDPDYSDDAPNALRAWYMTWYNRQPGVDGSIHHYKRILGEMGTPEAKAVMRHTIIMQLFFMTCLFTMAWNGYAIEAALVWWLPRHIGLSYTRFFLSWAPHFPRHERKGRYGNTRVFRSKVGYLASMGMEYHVIHHLYPNILIHRNRAAFQAMREILVARGVDCSPIPKV